MEESRRPWTTEEGDEEEEEQGLGAAPLTHRGLDEHGQTEARIEEVGWDVRALSVYRRRVDCSD